MSHPAIAAWGYLFTDTSTNVSHGGTVTVGGLTYQWRTTLTNVAGYLQLGAGLSTSLDALQRAITLTGTPGTDYAADTVINPLVTAWRFSTAMGVSALVAGAAGNSIAVSDAEAQVAWGWEGFVWGGTPITTLAGGEDADLTEVVEEISQVVAEVLHASDPASQRVAQVSLEVLAAGSAASQRVAQILVEVLHATPSGATSTFPALTVAA